MRTSVTKKATFVRLEEQTLRRIGELAKAKERPRAWLMAHAIREYVEREEWLIEQIQAGIREADEGRLIDHATVKGNWEAKRGTQMD